MLDFNVDIQGLRIYLGIFILFKQQIQKFRGKQEVSNKSAFILFYESLSTFGMKIMQNMEEGTSDNCILNTFTCVHPSDTNVP